MTGHIIGKSGKIISKIQQDSGCQLNLNSAQSNDKKCILVIKGKTQRELESAEAMVNEIITVNADLFRLKEPTMIELPAVSIAAPVAGLSNVGNRNLPALRSISSAVSLHRQSSNSEMHVSFEAEKWRAESTQEVKDAVENVDLVSERQTSKVIKDEWQSVTGKKSARANSAVSTGSSILHSIPFSTSGFALMEDEAQKAKKTKKKKKATNKH